jgi:hypothetical protein
VGEAKCDVRGDPIGSRFSLDLAWLERVTFVHEGVKLLLEKFWPEPLAELTSEFELECKYYAEHT